jgi:hypothetical protein
MQSKETLKKSQDDKYKTGKLWKHGQLNWSNNWKMGCFNVTELYNYKRKLQKETVEQTDGILENLAQYFQHFN